MVSEVFSNPNGSMTCIKMQGTYRCCTEMLCAQPEAVVNILTSRPSCSAQNLYKTSVFDGALIGTWRCNFTDPFPKYSIWFPVIPHISLHPSQKKKKKNPTSKSRVSWSVWLHSSTCSSVRKIQSNSWSQPTSPFLIAGNSCIEILQNITVR